MWSNKVDEISDVISNEGECITERKLKEECNIKCNFIGVFQLIQNTSTPYNWETLTKLITKLRDFMLMIKKKQPSS